VAAGVCVGVNVGLGVPGVELGVTVTVGLLVKDGLRVELGVRVEDGAGEPGVDDGVEVWVVVKVREGALLWVTVDVGVSVLEGVLVTVDAANRPLKAAPRQIKKRVRRRDMLNLKKCSTL
jgi:hypothetical protein